MTLIKSFAISVAVLAFLSVLAHAQDTCKFIDPCSKKPLWGVKNGMLIDECRNIFKIDGNCKLTKFIANIGGDTCKFHDACTNKPLWGVKNGLLIDECRKVYKTDGNCKRTLVGNVDELLRATHHADSA